LLKQKKDKNTKGKNLVPVCSKQFSTGFILLFLKLSTVLEERYRILELVRAPELFPKPSLKSVAVLSLKLSSQSNTDADVSNATTANTAGLGHSIPT